MAEDNEAMSGFWRQRSSGGLSKAAKAKVKADKMALANTAAQAKRVSDATATALAAKEAAAAGITPLGLPLGHGKRAREAGGVESNSTPAATSSLYAAKRAAGAAAFALTATLEPGKRARGEAGSGESTGFPGPSGVELTSELHAGEHAAGTAEHGGCCSGHGGCCSGKGARVAEHAAGTASSASGAAVDPSGTPAAISQLHRLWGTAPPFIRDPVVQQPGGATVSLQAARRGCGRRLPQRRGPGRGRSALQGVSNRTVLFSIMVLVRMYHCAAHISPEQPGVPRYTLLPIDPMETDNRPAKRQKK